MNGFRLSAFIILAIVAHAKAQPSKLIEVASFDKNQPIGVSVSPKSNRLFVSFPHKEPFLYALTEIINGKRVAYPNAEWNIYSADRSENHFVNVQDLHADDLNFLWVLDPGAPRFKLLKIDLSTNKVSKLYSFEDLPAGSTLNDMVIDNDKQLAYLSDPGLKAIIVLDLKTSKSRVVLRDDKSTTAQPGFVLNIDKKEVVDTSGKPFVSNVNGIALTKDNRYFYFRAINQTKLYRIETRFLADTGLTLQLSNKVEMVAETGVSHGMIADAKGNIYVSSSPDKSIKYVSPDGKLHTLVQDERIIWPDSFGIGNDGYLYFSCAQMNRLPRFNNGIDKTDFPYRVFKVKLP